MLYYKWQTDEEPSMYQTNNPVATWRWPVVKLSVQCAAAVAGVLAPATCLSETGKSTTNYTYLPTSLPQLI